MKCEWSNLEVPLWSFASSHRLRVLCLLNSFCTNTLSSNECFCESSSQPKHNGVLERESFTEIERERGAEGFWGLGFWGLILTGNNDVVSLISSKRQTVFYGPFGPLAIKHKNFKIVPIILFYFLICWNKHLNLQLIFYIHL